MKFPFEYVDSKPEGVTNYRNDKNAITTTNAENEERFHGAI